MRKYLFILCVILLSSVYVNAQQVSGTLEGYKVPATVYKNDTIPTITMREVIIFPEIRFKSKRQRIRYTKLVRDVKKTLPLAKQINGIVIETYEYLQTLPDRKAREEHLKMVEKGLKQQYTPIMKKLTFSQGKLLIKLVNRETNSSSYELVKAFMGSFKAGFYQTFAALFGASLKKEYHPEDDDKLTERVIILIENGQL